MKTIIALIIIGIVNDSAKLKNRYLFGKRILEY